jgi:hypothetical protein
MEKAQRDEAYNLEKARREEEAGFIQRRERLLTSGYEDRAKIDRDRYAEQMRLFEQQKNILEMNSRHRGATQQQQQQIGYEPDSLDYRA